MNVIGWVVASATGLLMAATVYLYALAIVGLLFRQNQLPCSRSWRFLILIPAHNESVGIIPTLESLSQVSGSHQSRTMVIADNCTDDTAAVARRHGVDVLERTDPDHRGKGYALQWAITQTELDDYDAVAVVDADTTVVPNLLEVLAGTLEDGADAVQLCYQFTYDNTSGLSQLQHLASLVENHLFHKPRALLGLAGFLRGSGMAVRSEVLRTHPWDSHSITEDVDYSLQLSRSGYRVDFSAASAVFSPATVDYDQAQTQKSRWSSGTFGLIADHFLPLISAGLRGRPSLIEAALALLLFSRPLMAYVAGSLAIIGLIVPDPLRWPVVLTNLGIAALLVGYLLFGILLAKGKKPVWRALANLPIFAFWYLLIQIKAVFGFRRDDWQRTERKNDA